MSDENQSATDNSEQPDVTEQPEPKPTETVDYWKRMSRENESRAKANADAAKRLEALEDAQKSESQKQQEAYAKAQRELEQARSEATAYRLAAKHGISPEYFDLLGTGDEDTLSARAERLGELLKSRSDAEQLRADVENVRQGKQVSGTRPVADLRPGATPTNNKSEEDLEYERLFGAQG